MRSKKMVFTNFSRSQHSESYCFRPENETQLLNCSKDNPQSFLLARGNGLSYGDSCFNSNHYIIDTQRLNHLINFDPQTGLAVCQGGTTLKDLFLFHPEYIPYVIPGTVHVTVAGAIAHDVHGKNNPIYGSFGQHLEWMDIVVKGKTVHCSRGNHADLFYATIAGLGLTGIIVQVGLYLRKASRSVSVKNAQFKEISSLIQSMTTVGLNYDYQVAWLDLLRQQPRAILSFADHDINIPAQEDSKNTVPKLPFKLINPWLMKQFNAMYYHSKPKNENLSLQQFNNPLDQINHWNRVYGPKGLMQFQAVFPSDQAENTIMEIQKIINTHKATPTLAVLKLFSKAGTGLLSFCRPGFTLAIDFLHNSQAKQAIAALNQFIATQQGAVYLAKDQLLTPEQYQMMYPKHQQFAQLIKKYELPMSSDLSRRLELTR